MAQEIEWRPVVGFEQEYAICNNGQLMRLGRARGATPGRIIRAVHINSGYLVYKLHSHRHVMAQLAHHVVANAFIGPRPAGYEVNHKNLNKHDNRAENLEYVTRSYNLLHRSASGIGRGERNGCSKLRAADVLAIRTRHDKGESYKRLGRAFGVAWGTIRKITKRRIWKWLA